MAGAGRPGTSPLTAQRERFGRLIAQGVSNSEACRLVGVNRRTGTRWRFGRSVPVDGDRARTYAPVLVPSTRPASSRYLSEEERILIADLHRAGRTCAEIADELARATSTVSRELARNRDEYGRYRGWVRTGWRWPDGLDRAPGGSSPTPFSACSSSVG